MSRDSGRFVFFHMLGSNYNRNPFYFETFLGVVTRRAPQGFVGREEMWKVVVHRMAVNAGRAARERQQGILCIFDVYPFLYSATSYINNTLHLARNYARIFVHGHHLSLQGQFFFSFALENCPLLGTDNVRKQIRRIFSHQMEVIGYMHVSTRSDKTALKLSFTTRIHNK